jgi:hypothetical protein
MSPWRKHERRARLPNERDCFHGDVTWKPHARCGMHGWNREPVGYRRTATSFHLTGARRGGYCLGVLSGWRLSRIRQSCRCL